MDQRRLPNGAHIANREAVGALIEDKLDEIMRVRSEMDAYVRKTYRDNPRVLSEWTSVKHIQRAPKGRRTPAEQVVERPHRRFTLEMIPSQ